MKTIRAPELVVERKAAFPRKRRLEMRIGDIDLRRRQCAWRRGLVVRIGIEGEAFGQLRRSWPDGAERTGILVGIDQPDSGIAALEQPESAAQAGRMRGRQQIGETEAGKNLIPAVSRIVAKTECIIEGGEQRIGSDVRIIEPQSGHQGEPVIRAPRVLDENAVQHCG